MRKIDIEFTKHVGTRRGAFLLLGWFTLVVWTLIFTLGNTWSKKEVRESWKEGFYAPTEPEKAIEYYTEKRKGIIHDKTLKPETRYELKEISVFFLKRIFF